MTVNYTHELQPRFFNLLEVDVAADPEPVTTANGPIQTHAQTLGVIHYRQQFLAVKGGTIETYVRPSLLGDPVKFLRKDLGDPRESRAAMTGGGVRGSDARRNGPSYMADGKRQQRGSCEQLLADVDWNRHCHSIVKVAHPPERAMEDGHESTPVHERMHIQGQETPE